jgi:hypothetical protein
MIKAIRSFLFMIRSLNYSEYVRCVCEVLADGRACRRLCEAGSFDPAGSTADAGRGVPPCGAGCEVVWWQVISCMYKSLQGSHVHVGRVADCTDSLAVVVRSSTA